MRKSKYVRDGEFELIENYELAKAADFKGWCIHHRDEYKVLPSGIEVFRTKAELIEDGRYYDCPANELIFITLSAHQAYHMKHLTKERRKNMSLSARGIVKGQWTLTRRKKLSASMKGMQKGNTWKVINGKRVWLSKEGN